jgi:superfamily II DNA/RNA helicase
VLPPEQTDLVPGAEIGEHADDAAAHRRALLSLAREAEALAGPKDAKLHDVTGAVRDLVGAGHAPIVFCRFIPTAEYVAEHLRKALKGVAVEAVTGLLAPADRERRIETLGQADRRVLVSTDCLSEGINLQHHFTAVVHYDLAWNPTRHEQREGRVDRYGQPRPTVQMVMVYGRDNRIDGTVLDVLRRKHERIRKALGVSVPVPIDTGQVMEAIFEGLLLRSRDEAQMVIEEVLSPQQGALHQRWDSEPSESDAPARSSPRRPSRSRRWRASSARSGRPSASGPTWRASSTRPWPPMARWCGATASSTSICAASRRRSGTSCRSATRRRASAWPSSGPCRRTCSRSSAPTRSSRASPAT